MGEHSYRNKGFFIGSFSQSINGRPPGNEWFFMPQFWGKHRTNFVNFYWRGQQWLLLPINKQNCELKSHPNIPFIYLVIFTQQTTHNVFEKPILSAGATRTRKPRHHHLCVLERRKTINYNTNYLKCWRRQSIYDGGYAWRIFYHK